MENGPVEDAFPIENGDTVFHCYVSLQEVEDIYFLSKDWFHSPKFVGSMVLHRFIPQIFHLPKPAPKLGRSFSLLEKFGFGRFRDVGGINLQVIC